MLCLYKDDRVANLFASIYDLQEYGATHLEPVEEDEEQDGEPMDPENDNENGSGEAGEEEAAEDDPCCEDHEALAAQDGEGEQESQPEDDKVVSATEGPGNEGNDGNGVDGNAVATPAARRVRLKSRDEGNDRQYLNSEERKLWTSPRDPDDGDDCLLVSEPATAAAAFRKREQLARLLKQISQLKAKPFCSIIMSHVCHVKILGMHECGMCALI